MMSIRSPWVDAGLGLVIVLGHIPLLAAQDKEKQDLRKAVADLAKGIKAVQNDNPIRIGHFIPVGVSFDNSNFGPGISIALTTPQQAEKVVVSPGAKFEVFGTFTLRPEAYALVITATIKDIKKDRDIQTFLPKEVLIKDPGDISRAVGWTGAIPNGTDVKNYNVIEDGTENPAVFISGYGNSLVSSSKGGDYAVEILAGAQGSNSTLTPRKAEVKDGRAFVTLEPDEVYKIRVVNKSEDEAIVRVSIDGINTFAFSKYRNRRTKQPRIRQSLVRPGEKGLVIPGWHKTYNEGKNTYYSFLVSKYAKEASAKFPNRNIAKLGVITVSFAKCYEPGSRLVKGNEEVGTVLGSLISQKMKIVKRVKDPEIDSVTIRYHRKNNREADSYK